MGYHTFVSASQNGNLLESTTVAPLTAARLSALRHDLRTPFNQIIGYAEMVGEDAEDAGDGALRETALAVATAAHSTLTQLTGALVGDPEQVTPDHLANARRDMAEPLQMLQMRAQELRAAVTASSALPEDAIRNLGHIETALASLNKLVAATSEWHTPAEAVVAPELSVKAPLPPTVSETKGDGRGEVPQNTKGTILIVDDHIENRDLLRQRLDREGFKTAVAECGLEALKLLAERPIDLVLLDVLMPGMDGIEVLQRIKASDTLKRIPVIMISALDEIERVVQCIEFGAEDYLSKPFNPVLLRARIGVTLERKRLRDEEEHQRAEMKTMLAELAQERQNAHNLLLNILPERVANDLQQGHSAPMYFEDTTICFTDFVGFTLSTESMPAELVVEELHTFFTAFDMVMERYGLEKMKTIGDSYMYASGLPKRHPANPVNAVLAALELVHETQQLSLRPDAPGWKLRIGLHTGPVIAGVVGIRKFAFDIWGDSVNFASRMESSGSANCINISERTYARVKDFFVCEHRGKVMTKDKREVDMYFVRGVHPNLYKDGTFSAFARRYRLYFSEEPPSFPEFLLGANA
jgi:class 3 adenylate cyclase/CheY-like chemotaxis protein